MTGSFEESAEHGANDGVFLADYLLTPRRRP